MTAHLTRVKARLSIHAHRKVRGLLEGEYAAIQVGRGIDFNDLREYVRGDDVKDIDWKASARARSLLVKRYVAERKHTVLLAVSTGRSMSAQASPDAGKREIAVLLAGVMGYLAVRHQDLVALVYGDAERQHAQPPDGGELYLERLLEHVHDAISPDGPPTDLATVLEYAARAVRRRAIMVVIADEMDLSERTVEALRRLSVQHEMLYLTVGDLDPTIPVALAGPRPIVDVDTRITVPTWLRGDRRLREEYAALVADEDARLRRALDQLGVVHERVADAESAIGAVFKLLERHRHARRR